MRKEEASAGRSLLYVERERGVVIPHVGDRTTASSQNGGAMVRWVPLLRVIDRWASVKF
jgi:hypothetical protein